MKITKTEIPEFNYKTMFNSRRFLFYAIGVSLLAVIVVLAALVPSVRQIFEIQKKITAQQARASKLRQKVGDLENIEAREAYQYTEAVNSVLPSKKPLLELLTSLNMVAVRNGVVFTDLSLTPGEIATDAAELAAINKAKINAARANAGYDAMDVALSVEGSFGSIKSFLDEIEKIAPLSTINSISLSSSNRGVTVSDQDLVSAELMIQIHYFTKPISVALEQPLPTVGVEHNNVLNEIQTYLFPSIEDQKEILSGGLEDLFQITEEEAQDIEVSDEVTTEQDESGEPAESIEPAEPGEI